jgi:hypothetical protein
MTHFPIPMPLRGFTEQSQYSAIPEGMTPSCLNVMPSDIWNGRTRISTRSGTRKFNKDDAAAIKGAQFVGTYRIYESNALVERIIFVRAGKVYYADPNSTTIPASVTLFGGQGTALLNTSGLVEGVQFNEHFYFVDGDHYVFVNLLSPSSGTATQIWGSVSASKHGPYHTDPDSVQTGERATLICRWGSRLVLAGYKRTPNIWYACSPDDVWPISGGSGGSLTDGWSGGNPIGAITGTTSQDYGTLGDPILAIFPFAQTGLMFACTNSFGFLTSDPAFDANASLVNLTKSIGIAGRRAWCQGQEKGAYILGRDGLYLINANDFNFNRGNRISAGRLDSFFLRLDFGTPAIQGSGILAGGSLRILNTETGSATGATVNTLTASGTITDEATAEPISAPIAVSSFTGAGFTDGEVFPTLCWDPDREGVWLFLTVSGIESASLHVFYDVKTDSFWPQRFYDPDMYGPTSAVYIGSSRSKNGRLIMANSESIAVMEKSFAIGMDGYYSGLEDETEIRTQSIRSSLTFGPIIAPLPQRFLLSEVRLDLSEDAYELPDGFPDTTIEPILSVSTGDTAQLALGLQSDTLFVTNVNPLVIDNGNAATSTFSPVYDGGNASAPTPERIDGRFALRPFGTYVQNDSFSSVINRVYDGPGNWQLKYAGGFWRIIYSGTDPDGLSNQVEYEQIIADPASPNGLMETQIQFVLAPDVLDNASVTGASFSGSEVTEIGELNAGRNQAIKCRVRSEAMYLTVASQGRPWSIERMSAVLSQVGFSRGGTP